MTIDPLEVDDILHRLISTLDFVKFGTRRLSHR